MNKNAKLFEEINGRFTKIIHQINKSITADSIDKNTLKELYTLSSIDFSSSEITLLWNPNDESNITIFMNYFGMELKKIKKLWLKAKLTGNGNPPTIISSDEKIIEMVANTPGAIGFVSSSKVKDNIKVLTTIN